LSVGATFLDGTPGGTPITERAAKALIADRFTVRTDVRARARAHSAATHRAKLTR
jgi:hypothetical protein